MILLNTHTLIWLDAGLGRLGATAREHLDTALQEELLAVSAISFWETGMLVIKDRVQLSIDLLQWRAELLASELKEFPVTGAVGIQAACN